MSGVGMRAAGRLALLRCLVVAVLVATSAAAPVVQVPGRAQDIGDQIQDARERAHELDDEAARAEQARDAAAAEVARLQGEVAVASQRLQAAQERVAEAEAVAEKARRRAEKAQRRLEAAERELEAKKDELATVVREGYMYGTQAMEPMLAALEDFATAENPTELADSLHVLELSMDDHAGLVEEAKRLVALTTRLRNEARHARQQAERHLAAAERASDEAAAVHARMQQLVDDAESAVQHHAATVADLRGEAAAAQQSIQQLHLARAASLVGPVDLVTVEGITVASSLAPDLRALLRDARADGIHLSGSGYRSPETTAQLRVANGCRDVHSSSPSSCAVPTARPGTSMHERGLAIDFTYQGQTICFPDPPSACHGNAGFDWLRANAHRYGLQVLSSEAWHWSVNGK